MFKSACHIKLLSVALLIVILCFSVLPACDNGDKIKPAEKYVESYDPNRIRNCEYAVAVTDTDYELIVSSFSMYGYMSSFPYKYDEIPSLLNDDNTLFLFSRYYFSVLTNKEEFSFLITEKVDGEYIPKGIIISEHLYNYEYIEYEITENDSLRFFKENYDQIIISPSLTGCVYLTDESSYSVLTDLGIVILKNEKNGDQYSIKSELVSNNYVASLLESILNGEW